MYTQIRSRGCRDHMVVGFTTTCAIRAYHHLSCEFKSRSWRGVLDTTICDKDCQWFVTGRWFSPISSTNKTDRHDITEILLKVVLYTPQLLEFQWFKKKRVKKYSIYDRLRSTLTSQIGVHWRHYLKLRSYLRVFSNRRLFQILRSMADLLLSIRRPFQSEDQMWLYLVTWLMLVKFVHHLHCILYQMNAKSQSSRHKIRAPNLSFVYKKKTHQRPSYVNQFESKI